MTSRLENLISYLEYAQDKLDDAQFVMAEMDAEGHVDSMAQLRIAQAIIHAVIGKLYFSEFRNVRHLYLEGDRNDKQVRERS
jgi:hypothetical protein